VLEQEILIAKVGELAVEDERLVAVLMYGSFALSEGDSLSDIEFYLYFGAPLDRVDGRRWLEGIAPIEMHYVNEFGTDSVIFANAIRGEFHFEPVSSIPSIAKCDTAWFPSPHAAIVIDRTGELTRTLAPFAQEPPVKDTRYSRIHLEVVDQLDSDGGEPLEPRRIRRGPGPSRPPPR